MTRVADHIVRTSILAEPSQLATLRDFVRSHVGMAGFTEYELNGIVLAIDEACANLIQHGYGNDATKHIDVVVDIGAAAVRIDIMDTARSFDPALAPQPDIDRYVADHRRGGWGIALMARVMDDIAYTPIGGEVAQNRLTLIKRRHHAGR